MIKYVVGFLLERSTRRVVLLTKARPAVQVGKLNGVGGHIEEGETPLEAMCREWQQETGTTFKDWHQYDCIIHPRYALHIFMAAVDEFDQDIITPGDEPVGWYDIDTMRQPEWRARLYDQTQDLLERISNLLLGGPRGSRRVRIASTRHINAPGALRYFRQIYQIGKQDLAFWLMAYAHEELSAMFIKDYLAGRIEFNEVDGVALFPTWEAGPYTHYYQHEETDCIFLKWGVADVHQAANSAGCVITDEEATDVLQQALRQHDASVGINWTTLMTLIMMSGSGRPMKPEEINRISEDGETLKLIMGDVVEAI